MAAKRTFLLEGRQVPGENIEFEASSEPFSQYRLADGTTVKVKVVMVDAVRLDGYNDQGDPLYQFQFQQIIGVVAPQELKKKIQ